MVKPVASMIASPVAPARPVRLLGVRVAGLAAAGEDRACAAAAAESAEKDQLELPV